MENTVPRVPLDERDWTLQEQWIWDQVCAGTIADLNERDGNVFPPQQLDAWLDIRIVRSAFLVTILLYEPFRSMIPHPGMRIVGAWIKEKLDLAHATLTHQLRLEYCRFESDIDFTALGIAGWLTLEGSVFTRTLNMFDVRVEGHVSLNNSIVAEIDLCSAQIKGSLTLSNATVSGPLNMSGLKVEGNLSIESPEGGQATFTDVDLVEATIGGSLALSNIAVSGPLNMSGLKVGGNLGMGRYEGGQATFTDVGLADATIGGSLALSNIAVSGPLNMTLLEVGGYFFLSNATVSGPLNMTLLEVGGSFVMGSPEGGQATFTDVDLVEATVGGDLLLNNATVSGPLNMTLLKVESGLDLRNVAVTGPLNMGFLKVAGNLSIGGSEGGQATFTDVGLVRATVGGDLLLNNATVSGLLNMRGFKVESGLYLSNATVSGPLDMSFLKVGGNLGMGSPEGGQVTFANLVLVGATVGGSLFLTDAPVTGTLNMTLLEVNTILDLSGATLGSKVDLTGAKISGELRLAQHSHVALWENDAQLILLNTEVGILKDAPNAWPGRGKLVLDGFTCGRFAGPRQERVNDLPSRPVSWLKKWLEKQVEYSSQPYEQLAKVLRQAGYEAKVTDILYASKRREHTETTRWWGLTWWGLTLQRLFIGYGYHNFWVLWWVFLFWAVGSTVLCVSGQGPSHKLSIEFAATTERRASLTRPPPSSWRHCWSSHRLKGMLLDNIAYSLDRFLPIIQLQKSHEDVALQGVVRWYFYLHQIMGYVLASFLIAGLTGLTKK